MNSKTTLVPILAFVLLSAPAFADSKSSKDVPAPEKARVVTSSITLNARNVASGRDKTTSATPNSGTARATTGHTATVEITVGNLGTAADVVVLHWFWIGRYEKSKNWFRSGDGEK